MPNRFVHRGRRTLPVGLAAVLVLGAAGCSGSASGGSTAQPAPSASSPSTSSDLQPSSDLRDEHPVEWSRSEQVGDSQVRVHFFMGDPHCYGARADVRATAATIEITVLQGTLPAAPDVCTDIAVDASLLVTTDTPVGGRRIVQP